ncbi:DUF2520 domain-containing protein [Derxia lacustris]|uniref:DUF2520 domain-containing protein n=1 Tax=Derxia lacustris TaxID=764842 RepID=UPI000A16D631|nr:DUF2520 domain-containing protein [Derxia lacustris]
MPSTPFRTSGAAAAPKLAFIGAGRLASTLARALARRGARVVAVASRQPASAQALAARLPGCIATAAQAAVDGADLVFLTVPDDAIAPAAAALRWRAGMAVVHCSGATELSALDAAAQAGAATGGFHPLQIFSDPELALDLLDGASVAIEAPAALEAQLRALAASVGLRPLRLPPGARARYHGSAGHAASFLLTLLHEAARVWASFGIAEDDALAALLPITRGTLAAAQSRGLAGAASGPPSRGDVGVMARHLAALDALDAAELARAKEATEAASATGAADEADATQAARAAANAAPGGHGALYRELTRRQLWLVERAGRVDAARLAAMARLIAAAPAERGD